MRLVARRLVARIDGSRWCIEQEGAHRPPAGRLLHPGLHLSAFCDLSVSRIHREKMCGPTNAPRCLFRLSLLRGAATRILRDHLSKSRRENSWTGYPGQDRTASTGHTRTSYEIISVFKDHTVSGSTSLNPARTEAPQAAREQDTKRTHQVSRQTRKHTILT